ncbi:MAG: Lrp/AsnC ligand binding domain-containing protein [Nanoarchaeota archaeon]
MQMYAMIGVRQTKLKSVFNMMKQLKFIKNINTVYGEYDIVAELNTMNKESSNKLLKQIKETDGVNTLKTFVVSDTLKEHKGIIF